MTETEDEFLSMDGLDFDAELPKKADSMPRFLGFLPPSSSSLALEADSIAVVGTLREERFLGVLTSPSLLLTLLTLDLLER
jgi:hypothetical protein